LTSPSLFVQSKTLYTIRDPSLCQVKSAMNILSGFSEIPTSEMKVSCGRPSNQKSVDESRHRSGIPSASENVK
jgi:hypothetical protein